MRRVRVRPLLALAAAAVIAGSAAPASASITFTSASFYIPLNISALGTFDSGSYHTISGPGVGPAFYMQQVGELRRVSEQLDVSLNTDLKPEMDNEIFCTDQDGHEVGRASAGTNYVVTPGGHEIWQLSMLIRADEPGNYTCGIQVQTDTGHGDHYQMTVWPVEDGDTSSGTWLQVSSADQVDAAEWRVYPLDSCPTADPALKCSYIGGPGSGAPATADLFGTPPDGRWTADNDATTIDATGTIQLTSCPPGTGSCPPNRQGNAAYAVVDSYLDVDQLNPDGSVCKVNRDYGWALGQSASEFVITTDVHHQPLSYHVSAPVSQNCGGSRVFQADLHYQWVAGDPVKIENGNVNVINSVRATTTTVPPVLGGTEAQADAAIQAAQLTVAPTYVMSPAAPGSVLSENSPDGTVEPTGSSVQITVSLGQASVPNVLSFDQQSAEQAITNAGLSVGTVSYNSNCTDPGDVLTQNPSAGVQVPAGTSVNIQVSTCPSGGGGSGGTGGGGNGSGNPHHQP